jgi:dihydrodipicolinate synthase/N-acetylneuraminate lyase
MMELPDRDGIEVIESRMMRPDMDADTFRVEVTLVSIGPDDVQWFNENCPQWRDHLSARRVEAQGNVSGLELVMATDPMALIQHMRKTLAITLADEIVKNMEPITSRYQHGKWVRL